MTQGSRVRHIWSRFSSSRITRATGLALAVMVVALVGAWFGLLLGGHTDIAIGPVQTRVALQPALSGQTVVNVPPLGTLQLNSHKGPVRLDVTVQSLNERDVRDAVTVVALRGLLAALAGSVLLGTLVFRRPRRVLLTGGVSLAVLAASGGTAAATWKPNAILEPRYTGLLASAPSLIGTTQDILTSFQTYRRELARLVTNVSQLYQATSHLPTYQPNPDTIRVLDVSDIHDNPAAWNVMHSLTREFSVNLIIDSGDLTDHGSRPEDALAGEIPTFHVPYVFVKGNHDSLATQRAVAKQRNAVVLVGKEVVVGGLRIIGAGDPRFTPNLSVDVPGEQSVVTMGRDLAAAARRASQPPDIAVVHDPAAVVPLDGTVGLVLAGHLHKRQTETMPNGTLLFVLGGTGVQIQRHLVPPPRSAGQVAPVPTAGR